MDPYETFCDPDFVADEPRDCWDVISELAVWAIGSTAALAICACAGFVIGWKL